MSLNMSSRRLVQSGKSASYPPQVQNSSASNELTTIISPSASGLTTSLQHLHITSQYQQTRTLSIFGFGRKKKTNTPEIDFANEVRPPPVAAATRARVQREMTPGKIEGDSIFSDELAATPLSTTDAAGPGAETGATGITGLDRSKDVLARAVDPDPRSRVRWQRKMVIRHVIKATDPFSKETREARIKRTEREVRQKSHFMPTSVKKLVHLTRQIAGKTVEDALVQMQYSKKKMAREVAFQLELARDRAIVERGMGLGKVQAEGALKLEGDVSPMVQKIQTKEGKWVEIEDPTRMYVAQAWVERGPWRGMEMSARARGRADKILKPSTGESIRDYLTTSEHRY